MEDGQTLADVGRRLDAEAAELGPETAIAALQGAVNDLGDAQVAAETAPDGLRAKRVMPRIAVDDVLGPRTRQAVRLALHHDGEARLGDALTGRLRRLRRDEARA